MANVAPCYGSSCGVSEYEYIFTLSLGIYSDDEDNKINHLI